MSNTPQDVAIKPRHLHFDVADILQTDWFAGDAFKTAYFNALSMTFPVGETLFIDAVRAFRDQVKDPDLKQEIRGFIGQEALHTREHKAYNKAFCERGYDHDWMQNRMEFRKKLVEKRLGHMGCLAFTVAAEHFTAILADEILKNPEWMQGIDPRMQALWRWHAVEEIEHKSVAFDVYKTVGGTTRMRRVMMVLLTIQLNVSLFLYTTHMLKRDGQLWKWSTFKSAMKFLYGRKGLYTTVLGKYLGFFKKSFSPWQEDNRELISEWAATYDEHYKHLESRPA